MNTVKIHFRTTREVEIPAADAKLLCAYAKGEPVDTYELNRILSNIRIEAKPARIEDSFIPAEWLIADLRAQNINCAGADKDILLTGKGVE